MAEEKKWLPRCALCGAPVGLWEAYCHTCGRAAGKDCTPSCSLVCPDCLESLRHVAACDHSVLVHHRGMSVSVYFRFDGDISDEDEAYIEIVVATAVADVMQDIARRRDQRGKSS